MTTRSDLLAIASQSGIPYAILHERWEEGDRGRALRAPYQAPPRRKKKKAAAKKKATKDPAAIAQMEKCRRIAKKLGLTPEAVRRRMKLKQSLEAPSLRTRCQYDGRSPLEWAHYLKEHGQHPSKCVNAPALDVDCLRKVIHHTFGRQTAHIREGETERETMRRVCRRYKAPHPDDPA